MTGLPEAEPAQRFARAAPPILAGDPPAERLVMQRAEVRRRQEIVVGRDAEALGRDIKLFEQPALRRKAIDHAPLAADFIVAQGDFTSSSSRRRPGPTVQPLGMRTSGSRPSPG